MMKPAVSLGCCFVMVFVHLCGATDTFTIGALFHEENYQAEIAFKYAIAFQNMYNVHGTYFKTDIKRVSSRRDTFTASKILCNIINSHDGVVAIITPASQHLSEMVESMCKKVEIPHIQTHRKLETGLPDIVVNFYPDPGLIAQAYATVVRYMNWNKGYVILYEDNDSLTRLQEVLKITNVGDVPIMMRHLAPGLDHRTLLKELKGLAINNIILDCKTDRILNILTQAKEVDLLEQRHNYFLTSLDAHTLDFKSLNTYANITIIRLVDPENYALKGAVRNWALGEIHENRQSANFSPVHVTTESALTHDSTNLLMESINELHKTQKIIPRRLDCQNSSDTWEGGYRLSFYMRKHPLQNATTGPIIFDEFRQRINFTLQIVSVKSAEITATWESWHPTELRITNWSPEDHAAKQLKNLQEKTIIVASKLVPPYLMKRHSDSHLTGNSRYEGYCFDLIDLLARDLNFTYEFRIVDTTANFNDEKKVWEGVIGEILYRGATLGIGDLTINHQRRQVVDFSTPFMSLGIAILHKKPTKEPLNMFAFLDPFSEDVWLYTVTLFMAVSITLYFIARMAPGDWENPHPCDENPTEFENIWSIKNCFWLTLGSIMTQGCEVLPKGLSSRMATAMWWFFSLLMTSSYTANLAAFLSKKIENVVITSAEALERQQDIKYGLMEGGATETFFKTSNYTTYKKMWNRMCQFQPSVFERTNADGVRLVLNARKSDFAFLMESSSMEYEIEKHCQLRRMGELLDEKGYGIAMPLNSEFRSRINLKILEYLADGTLGQLKTEWWQNRNDREPCEGLLEAGDNTGKLDLTNVGGVFVVLTLGIIIAFLIAIVEFLWNVRRVSVKKHVSYCTALAMELNFVTNFGATTKLAKLETEESPSSSSKYLDETPESQSTHKVLHSDGSFFNLDEAFDNIHQI